MHQYLFNFESILGTGCREYYPGQWTYDWTPEFGQQEWFNFADAWAACKSIDCGSIGQFPYYLRSGTSLNSDGPIPNQAFVGCWVKITDTRSTYCNDLFSAGTSPGK